MIDKVANRKVVRYFHKAVIPRYHLESFILPDYTWPSEAESETAETIEQTMRKLEHKHLITGELSENYLDEFVDRRFQMSKNALCKQEMYHKILLEEQICRVKAEIQRLDEVVMLLTESYEKLQEERGEIEVCEKSYIKWLIVNRRKHRMDIIGKKLGTILENAELSMEEMQKIFETISEYPSRDQERFYQLMENQKDRKSEMLRCARQLRDEIILRQKEKLGETQEEKGHRKKVKKNPDTGVKKEL